MPAMRFRRYVGDILVRLHVHLDDIVSLKSCLLAK